MWFGWEETTQLLIVVFFFLGTLPLPLALPTSHTHKTHTHTHTHTLSLFALIRVQNEAFALQSMTERAWPPGSIHREQGGGREREREREREGEILTDLRGAALRRKGSMKDGAKYSLKGELESVVLERQTRLTEELEKTV